MPFLTPGVIVLWLVTVTLELALAFYCQPQKHPVFRAYIWFCLVRSYVLLWASSGHPYVYWYGYWTGAALEGVLILGVMFEVSTRVFHPIRTIPRHIRVIFLPVTATLVVITLLASSLTQSPPLHAMAVGRAIERTTTLVLFAGTALSVALSSYLGIPWKRHAFGIGVGLVVNLAVSTVSQIVCSPFVLGPWLYLRYVQMFGFVLAEIIWLRYLRNPEPELTPISKSEAREVLSLVEALFSDVESNQKCHVGRLR